MPAEPTIAEFRVRYAETDQMGVVYHANYLVWCEIGRTEYLRAQGTSYRVAEDGGVSLAVADASIRYHAPARYDDVIRVTTTLTEVRSRALTFDYEITDAERGTRFATARTLLVSLSPAGRVAPLPVAFLDRLADARG
jgi:acyl-CoA thioester hydrolase